MDAVILAAGMGRRLKSLTKDKTKCMLTVNDTTLIERMLKQLDNLGLNKIVIIVGYQSDKLIEFTSHLDIKTKIEYVFNDIYDKTNNIYSLFLAKHYLENSDCLILEADLIFEDGILEDLIADANPNLALVDKFESWMDGTVVTIDENNTILNFYAKNQFSFKDIKDYYKTVNIYKFSQEFSKHYYVPFLEAYIKSLGYNAYYEQVLKIITNLNETDMKIKKLTGEKWYEIDNVQDLDIARSIFAGEDEKLNLVSKREGGYWRYSALTDYTNFSNPYFPPKTLISEMKFNFEELLKSRPSHIDVNTLLVCKYFNITPQEICVANGIHEIVKYLTEYYLSDDFKIAMMDRSFNMYVPENNRVIYNGFKEDYKYDSDDIISYFSNENISMLILANPDNICGNYIFERDMKKLINWARENNIILVIDGSYIDFVDAEHYSSFLSQENLDKYSNLIMIEDISCSYGISGLSLCVLASQNEDLIRHIKQNLPKNNIDSFSEFYLQIFEKYNFEYEMSLVKFKNSRKQFIESLNKINGISVITSQSCFIVCEVSGKSNSRQLSKILLNDYNILVKDLSAAEPFKGKSLIKIMIGNDDENNELIDKLAKTLN